MPILVTGGAGFIGSNFVRYWLKEHPGDFVVVLDALTYAGNRASLPSDGKSLRFVQGDIRDGNLVFSLLKEYQINALVHFAAESHVDRSIHAPETFLETNVTGTLRLLEASRDYFASGQAPKNFRFHHISTDEVYGSLGTDDSPFEETTPYAPNSPYAASKAASDHLVRAWHHTYGLPVTVTNCSNNYGPYQFPEKLIPLMLINILEGKSLPVYGDGLNIRDWLFVEDHCRGIDLALTRGQAGAVYNLGGDTERTNIEVVKMLCDIIMQEFVSAPTLSSRFPNCPAAKGTNPSHLITYIRDRLGHDRRYGINATKAQKELGYRPQESFESGLHRTVQWYLNNESWWRNVVDGSYRTWIALNYATC